MVPKNKRFFETQSRMKPSSTHTGHRECSGPFNRSILMYGGMDMRYSHLLTVDFVRKIGRAGGGHKNIFLDMSAGDLLPTYFMLKKIGYGTKKKTFFWGFVFFGGSGTGRKSPTLIKSRNKNCWPCRRRGLGPGSIEIRILGSAGPPRRPAPSSLLAARGRKYCV